MQTGRHRESGSSVVLGAFDPPRSDNVGARADFRGSISGPGTSVNYLAGSCWPDLEDPLAAGNTQCGRAITYAEQMGSAFKAKAESDDAGMDRAAPYSGVPRTYWQKAVGSAVAFAVPRDAR